MAYVCTSCGIEYAKWQGKCDGCLAWNQIVSVEPHAKSHITSMQGRENAPKKLEEVAISSATFLPTGDGELDRVLGGGILPGALVLLGGEPGIGKSTLLLQMALQLSHLKVLYVSGEETENQIKMRSSRLGLSSPNCFIMQERSCMQVFKHSYALQPALLIIDSIQTLYCEEAEGSIGTIHQIRAATIQLLHYAKQTGVSIFLIGHVNKEGSLAGPKLLEHMVDTVLQFEADSSALYRMVRTIKNRFGPTSELGIYAMTNSGLQGIKNPSALLISKQNHTINGIAIGCCLEGTRPLIVEIQSLVTKTPYGNPQRNATGYDLKRLTMLLAVLEKRGGLRLHDQDVFLNITGGIRVDDPALDAAVSMAITSSLLDRPINQMICFIAEVGLGGELRQVQRIEQRIAEAKKLGFKRVFIAAQHQQLEIAIVDPIQDLKQLIKALQL